MILYYKGAFGLNLLTRFHGSACYRAFLPGSISVIIFLLINLVWRADQSMQDRDDLNHPYAVGVFVGAVSFLVVFRANFGYQRYWEACTSTFTMMSKWMDASSHVSTFHMQCDHYECSKPPSFYDYPGLKNLYLTRDRERGAGLAVAMTSDASLRWLGSSNESIRTSFPSPHSLADGNAFRTENNNNSNNNTTTGRESTPKQQQQQQTDKAGSKQTKNIKSINFVNNSRHEKFMQQLESPIHESIIMDTDENGEVSRRGATLSDINEEPVPLMSRPRLDGGWKKFYGDGFSTFYNREEVRNSMSKNSRNKKNSSSNHNSNNHQGGKTSMASSSSSSSSSNIPQTSQSQNQQQDHGGASPQHNLAAGFAAIVGGRTPPLFLQELVHLTSLLNGVALATLRNDIDTAESPLNEYIPGSPWPQVDPGKIRQEHKRGRESKRTFATISRYLLGMDRTPEARTQYNASRPLPVLGGVSDSEIFFLQMARGPNAKVQLCWQWLSEFIVREHLAGSLGEVGSPIISRVMQFLGDGMLAYNQARKVMFIPFPFPHAQLSAFAIILVTAAVPFLMDQYTNETWLGILLTLCTVVTISGLHEVARELENPFRNVPNDIPLCTLQAMFNETLVTFYAGYHPDSYWDPNSNLPKRTRRGNSSQRSFQDLQDVLDDTNTSKANVVDHNDGIAAQDSMGGSSRLRNTSSHGKDNENFTISGGRSCSFHDDDYVLDSSAVIQLRQLIDDQATQLDTSRKEIERLRALVEGGGRRREQHSPNSEGKDKDM